MKAKNTLLSGLCFTGILLMIATVNVLAQEKDQMFGDLEELQDESEELYRKIHRIIKDHPEFSYKYVVEDGKVEEVVVEGVDDKMDAKRLATLIYDLKKTREEMLNMPTRAGVFYSVEEEAEPANGYEGLREDIQRNVSYPDQANEMGVEGTIYLKFVVNSDGTISNLKASEDIETPYQGAAEELKKEAIRAFKQTEVDWEPATVASVPVDSYVVIPIEFDFRKNPTLPAMIR